MTPETIVRLLLSIAAFVAGMAIAFLSQA